MRILYKSTHNRLILNLYKSTYLIRVRPRIKATNSISKALYKPHKTSQKTQTEFRDTRILQNTQTKNQPHNLCLHHPNQPCNKKQKEKEVKRRNQTETSKRIEGKLTEGVHGTPGWSQSLQRHCLLQFVVYSVCKLKSRNLEFGV
jgi:dethiobiotin synthetase